MKKIIKAAVRKAKRQKKIQVKKQQRLLERPAGKKIVSTEQVAWVGDAGPGTRRGSPRVDVLGRQHAQNASVLSRPAACRGAMVRADSAALGAPKAWRVPGGTDRGRAGSKGFGPRGWDSPTVQPRHGLHPSGWACVPNQARPRVTLAGGRGRLDGSMGRSQLKRSERSRTTGQPPTGLGLVGATP